MQHTLDGRGSETTKLLGYGTGDYVRATMKPRSQRKAVVVLVSVTIFLLGALLGYFYRGSYNDGEYQRLERQWRREESHHANIREQWNKEEEMHERKRSKMSNETAKWEQERSALDADREKWAQERNALHTDREKWAQQRNAIDADRKKWAQERLDKAKKEHDDEERKRNDLVWEGLTPASRCLSYGTREYTATLSNVAASLDALVECANKSISIHGRETLPSSCTPSTSGSGRVIGHWNVDFNEAACTPWWSHIVNKGCDTRMGSHRYMARLMNLKSSEDWQILCKTTPATINGVRYNGATSCLNGRWGRKYGTWFVQDSNCQ